MLLMAKATMKSAPHGAPTSPGGIIPARALLHARSWADEGDEVSINADFISVGQAVVTLEIENALYNSEIEIEAVTLTTDKARELARALLSVVEAIEFVRTPTNLLRSDRKSHPAAEHEPRYPLLMQFSPSLSAIKNSLIAPASRLRTRQNVMANEGAEAAASKPVARSAYPTEEGGLRPRTEAGLMS
jgi:hypothetical protein